MRIKIIITVAVLLLVSSHAGGQSLNGKQSLSEIEWNSRTITEGVVLRWVQARLFDSDQAIYIVETDTTAGQFEFGVAAGDKPLITSVYAAGEGVLAAVNGTFFNMQEGYNVHYVRVNDSVVAVTDEKEYGIRATGIFTATGEVVDISGWGPESEDSGTMLAEDAIVTGPLLTDNGRDIALDSINFNKNRHPRSLLGITGTGHVLFIAVDGRQPGYADGMSLFELRELAKSLGCTEILNLDGGGSTTLYVKGEGVTGVVNRPSGKVERPVPSIVFVKNKE
ncbi:MAG: phosphodiester glycosidase family protein [Bacteroidales bacterium]|jgi:exopolysaccharide biosynthesis protein|nr:phosphodiester glycosidase family protein [Bacteroidales bacterium]HOO65524.1 phosphodiester glycosidase family protein [Bacteroidales bacterium]HPE22969.1 phosphodiester glycosidase family protein [Bacteroidales bacterium]HPJ04118.1 phosphodiester glycosidase family protein [Bacteroidales bacterium]HPQ62914.1 phosphodiester glycosidase family protein [Bacteroidales bacterium]